MSNRAPKGAAKAAAYMAYEQNLIARKAAQAMGVQTNSVYHAARRCGLTLKPATNRPTNAWRNVGRG